MPILAVLIYAPPDITKRELWELLFKSVYDTDIDAD